jgi:hypothetical protein
MLRHKRSEREQKIPTFFYLFWVDGKKSLTAAEATAVRARGRESETF